MAKKGSRKVLKAGSPEFIERMEKGDTVRVGTQDWINYWAEVHEGKDKEIERLRSALNEAIRGYDNLRAERIQLEETIKDLKIDVEQARGNFEHCRADMEGFRHVAVLALLPLAAVFGSASIQVILTALARAAYPGNPDATANANVYFNKMAESVCGLSGKLNMYRPTIYQRLSLLISKTRGELDEISRPE